MFKLIHGPSFFKDPEEGKATLLFGEEGGLTKQAAAMEIEEYVRTIEPKEGFFYLHINAMGAGEFYGANRNGDYFPEAQLIKWHKTFETNPAHVFRHHVNKDPTKSIGKVIFSYYNPRMHRVELIAEVDKVKGEEEYTGILEGKYPVTSMACKTPYDVCSICGNQAHNVLSYCSHLKEQINQILPDGRKVMSYNNGPLSFFDISIVIRPADITSSVLQKVANAVYTGSAEMAEIEGVNYDKVSTMVEYAHEKRAAIKKQAMLKVSELIKEIQDGEILDIHDPVSGIVSSIGDLDEALIAHLKEYPLDEVLNAMAELGLNPSMEFMSALLLGKYLGMEHIHMGASAVEAFMSQENMEIPEYSEKLIPEVVEKAAHPELLKLLMHYVEIASYSPEMVEKRAAVMPEGQYSVPAGGNYTGYTNWDIGRTNGDLSGVKSVPVNSGGGLAPELLQLLYTIAGGALIAKYVINGLAGIKLNKSQSNWLKSSVERSPLTKSAEIAPKLMELSVRHRFSKARA